MGYKLCMAEKPSVAKDIAAVIGANKRCNGYYEGNGYRVTWAVGHLVGLAEPEEYGFVGKAEMWSDEKEKAYGELPIIPKEFKLVVLEPTKDQFEIVKELIHRADTDMIINCGDMGPEGHILQWFIREMAGCTKPVKRFCATSMTEEAIRHAMKNLREEKEFENIIKGEFCKKKADWMLGMNMSRVESIKYNTGINVGRVQSPTLFFVFKRYWEVMNFKITDYYGLDATLKEGFHVYWKKDTDGLFAPKDKDSEGRVLNKGEVEKKRQEILRDGEGIVTEAKKVERLSDRPQLFDITELQREANRRYGYTAAVTLATAQALYETQKVLSYPRTDSRYITSDLQGYMPQRIKEIGTISRYQKAVDGLLKDGLTIDKKIVDDSKVTDHHAIIATEKIKGFDVSAMAPTSEEKKKGVTAETMRNILDLVLSRMLISFSKPHRYEQTSIKVQFPNKMILTASGKRPVFMGWKEMQALLLGKEQEETDEEEQTLPEVREGQKVHVSNCDLMEKKTTPPKLHTEATLLTEMENAGNGLANGYIIKGRGIGTQATRAEIIKKLFDTGVCEFLTKGKTNYIKPTNKGIDVIQVLPPELYSPKMTADWETMIADIADGKMTEKQFMDKFHVFLKEKVEQVKKSPKTAEFKRERPVVGTCPWCGEDLYRYEERNPATKKITKIRHSCSNKENCNFFMATDNAGITTYTGKKMTEKQMMRLIAKGQVVLKCKSKAGNEYDGKFTLFKKEVNGKFYANTQFSFADTKKKK